MAKLEYVPTKVAGVLFPTPLVGVLVAHALVTSYILDYICLVILNGLSLILARPHGLSKLEALALAPKAPSP
jgi:hypothetical protein